MRCTHCGADPILEYRDDSDIKCAACVLLRQRAALTLEIRLKPAKAKIVPPPSAERPKSVQ
jgi:hypothetical protein